MAENPPDKDRHNVIVRTCRVVLDVRIRITEITPENVAAYFTPDETSKVFSWEWAERQNRLLTALLQDKEVLDQFLAHIAKGDLGFFLESERIKGLPEEAEEDLFAKVYSGMDSADRIIFEEARKHGILFDYLELIHKAVEADLKETDIIDVRVLQPDEESTSSTSFTGGGSSAQFEKSPPVSKPFWRRRMSHQRIGIHRDILKLITSREADEVTPLMNRIYHRLVITPPEWWDSKESLRVRGGMRDGVETTAWDELINWLQAAPEEVQKALEWLHEKEVFTSLEYRTGREIKISFAGLYFPE